MKLGPEPESEPKPVKKVLGAGQKWTGSATLILRELPIRIQSDTIPRVRYAIPVRLNQSFHVNFIGTGTLKS